MRCCNAWLFILVQMISWPLVAAMPPSIEDSKDEPVIYTGNEKADKRWHHGGFRAAVGVHKIQVYRTTRNQPLAGDHVGWTYNHAPMLAYWQGRFWMNYVSNRVEEHGTPGKTGFASSFDGYHWETPQTGFPIISLPEIKPPSRYFRGRGYGSYSGGNRVGHAPAYGLLCGPQRTPADLGIL